MFGFIKNIFIGLLTGLVIASNHTKYISFSNIFTHEYTEGLRYYPSPANLDRYVGSCNTRNFLSSKIRIPNKKEDLNLIEFNMITGINESKTLTKHISYECKSKINGRKCNSNQKWNNNKCGCEC